MDEYDEFKHQSEITTCTICTIKKSEIDQARIGSLVQHSSEDFHQSLVDALRVQPLRVLEAATFPTPTQQPEVHVSPFQV